MQPLRELVITAMSYTMCSQNYTMFIFTKWHSNVWSCQWRSKKILFTHSSAVYPLIYSTIHFYHICCDEWLVFISFGYCTVPTQNKVSKLKLNQIKLNSWWQRDWRGWRGWGSELKIEEYLRVNTQTIKKR